MPNKKSKNSRKGKKQNKPQNQQSRKSTPFATTGEIVGGAVGKMFNLPGLSGVGKWLGSGIGSIFGSGDYQITGQSPQYNVLSNGSQIPQFRNTTASNVICNREYLGDVTGTSLFSIDQYPLNPGIAKTFPWLSTVAQNYTSYKFHGIIFEYRSMLTDNVTSGTPGTIVFATNYDAEAIAYDSKQEMENSEFAVSNKPTENLIHGIECAMNQTVLTQRYVRTGELAADLDKQLYDWGNTMIATTGNPVTALGEIWISYCVEFFKPKMPREIGGNIQSVHYQNASYITSSELLGANPTLATNTVGNLVGFLPAANSVSWYAPFGNVYLVQFSWINATSIVCTPPTPTYVGLSSFSTNAFAGATSNTTPINLTSSNKLSMTFIVRGVRTTPGLVTLSLAGGTIPDDVVDVWITQISSLTAWP